MPETLPRPAPQAAPLPPSLGEIAKVAGRAAATALGHAKAGRRVYVPANAGQSHWLTRLLGTDAARKLCFDFGGNYLVIPTALGGEATKRRDAIDRLSDSGASVDEIAATLGVDRRTVQRRRAARRRQAA